MSFRQPALRLRSAFQAGILQNRFFTSLQGPFHPSVGSGGGERPRSGLVPYVIEQTGRGGERAMDM
jgi:hypothetical protein